MTCKTWRFNYIYTLNNHDALLITDIQIDFLPGGALPVPGGDEILLVINNYITRFSSAKAHIIASRDWHPPNHISFTNQGGPWPPHCVQNTEGAKLSSALKMPKNTVIVSKATNPKLEAYSAFDHTNLYNELQKLNVKRFFIAGLATDYCILNTVLDARKLGLDTVVLTDATMGINVKPGDVDRAFIAMAKSGAVQASEADFPELEDELPTEEAAADSFAEKSSMLNDAKKKARMRSKSASKRIKTEKRR